MTNLSEQDREALATAVCTCGHDAEWHSALIGCNAADFRDVDPCDCRNDWLDAVMVPLADIVRRAKAEAWEEGFIHQYHYEGAAKENPYRAPGGAQEPVLASNTRSVDLGDAGDVQGAQNGADDGVRGGGA